MKIHVRAFVLAALFAVMSLVPTLNALTGMVAKVNVPFAFDCGSRHFAPGVYTLQFLNLDIMELSNGRDAALVMIAPESSPMLSKAGYAEFTKYGNRYFLDGIWMPDSSVHVSISRFEQKWEKRAATELARRESGPARIQLALLSASQPGSR